MILKRFSLNTTFLSLLKLKVDLGVAQHPNGMP
jgi:hypothetical protein